MKSEIFQFFNKYIDAIDPCDGGGIEFNFPTFEQTPRDFLGYAKNDLDGTIDSHRLVNATGNLKRAMDCELDYLLSILGLSRFYREKRLGIDKKLGFFKKSGIFSANSLDRLNKFRNRLEHHYEIPKLEDVHVYYDLVTAFISLGDKFLYKIRSISDVSFYYKCSSNFEIAASTYIDLQISKIEVLLVGNGLPLSFSEQLTTSSSVDELNIFAYLLKVNQLMGDFYYTLISKEEFLSILENEIKQTN